MSPEIIIDVINYPLVYVPEGPFVMGTHPTGLRKADEEAPQREVTLNPFYIGRYPVTNAQYAQFVEATGHVPPRFHADARFNPPDCPVVGVSWNDAQTFLDWLNSISLRDLEHLALTDESYRLPTEAEWEKAARGVDGREYPWGNRWDAAKGNFAESGPRRLTPVGSYPDGVSPYDCYDMAGNAYDWCNDWFHPQTYRYSPAQNPQGPIGGRRKVVRGGAWITRGEYGGRCANRAAYEPTETPNCVSFRIAKSVI